MKVILQLNTIFDQVLEPLLFLGTVLYIIRYSDKQEKYDPCHPGAYIMYLTVLYTEILVFS